MKDIKVLFKRTNKNAIAPRKGRGMDACFDLFADTDFILPAGAQFLINTGVQLAIPDGYCGIIKERSGLACNNRVHVNAGVIDSNYRGNIIIALENRDVLDCEIQHGKAIAQIKFERVLPVSMVEVSSLDETERGTDGFGSSDKK